MRDRWATLCKRIGTFSSEGEAELTFETISTLYTHPPRAYHNLHHIQQCLNTFDEVARLVEDRDCVEFAIWMHDCVFMPERPDNESRSADAAGMVAGLLGCQPEFAARAKELIGVTRHHQSPARGDPAILSDIDLSILGAEPTEYEEYRRAIRAEFSFADDEMFRDGRTAFLERMLARTALYSTQYFLRELEWNARNNMENELEQLRTG